MLEAIKMYFIYLYYGFYGIFTNLSDEAKSFWLMFGVVTAFILLVRLYGWLKRKDYGPVEYESTDEGPHTISGRSPDPADPADPYYLYRYKDD